MSRPWLITGGSGLLGGMLLWVWRGRPLAAMARPGGAYPAGAWPGAARVAGDLGDPESLEKAVRRCEPGVVVHCAALTNVDRCEKEPALALEVNARASGALALAAKRAGAAFVYIGSDAVYADGPGPHAEDRAGGVLSVYAQSKLAGEGEVLAAHPKALVLRTCIFGWHQSPSGGGLAQWAAGNLLAGETLPGFGDVGFSPLFTASLAGVIEAGLQKGLAGIYNLGSRNGMSKYRFLKTLAEKLGADPGLVRESSVAAVSFAAPRPADPVMDPGRLARDLAWEPPELKDEIARMAAMARDGRLAAFRENFGG